MRKSIHFTVIILSVALVFGLVSRAPAGISDRFDQAKSYREDKQYDQAEQIYRQITAEFPDSNDALEAQKQLTCLYASTGRQAEADTTLGELTAGFSSHKDVAQAVHDIAYHYRTINRQEKANEVDQSVLSAWPQSDYAVLGQMDIAKYYVDKGNDQSAQVAIDKLLSDFSGNPLIARAVHDIGQHYRWAGKYEKANRLYKHAVVNFPGTEHALWAQADLIKSYLALKDDPNTEAAIEKLLADFSHNPLKSRAIHDTAYEHRKLEKYDRADQLDQFVIDNWPRDEQAMWAKMDMTKTNILLENDAAVEPAIDSLIADFNDQPELANAVFQIGEEYYYKGFMDPNKCHIVKSVEDLDKANDIWDKIAVQCPKSDSIGFKHAAYFTAVSFRRRGQYQKALTHSQKVMSEWPDYQYAWSAQYMIADCARMLRRNGDMPKVEADALRESAYLGLINNYVGSPLEKRALRELGGYYVEKEQWSQALDYYNSLLEKDYGYFNKVYLSMLRCYNELGLTEMATELQRVKQENAKEAEAN